MRFPRSAADPVLPRKVSPPHATARRRRGVVVLVVILLLSMTLALSYAAVRSQNAVLQVERNSERKASARQIAMTGLVAAIKKMHGPNWNGLGTTLSGSLSTYESYQVKYTFGDSSLTASSPDYADYPYRVTLESTGSAADSDNPQCVSTHKIRAVVRLVPRKLPDEPADWATMQQYTVYQTKKDGFQVDIPCRFEGYVRAQDKLRFAYHYPDDSSAWSRYLSDLNAMRLAGQSDYRPFNGPVYLAISQQESKYYTALTTKLGVSVVDTAAHEAGGDWVNLTSLTTYRLYPNGPAYTIPAVADTLANVTLGPDPLSNPLGIYYRDGNLTIQSGVSIRGSLFCQGDVQITGTNVRFDPLDMPNVYPAQTPLRLPVLTCNNFTLTPTGGAIVNGLLAVFVEFKIQQSSETVTFPLTGRLIACKITINERQPWNSLNWGNYYNSFWWQLFLPHPQPYFPVWMGSQGRSPQPRLTFQQDTTAVAYHWFSPYNPIFISHPDDGGLRWELVRWIDNP